MAAGDSAQLERLSASAHFAWESPYEFRGRGSVWVFIDSDGRSLRVSDGGRLVKFLEAVGMDPALDPIVSRVLLHAVNDTPGVKMKSGRVFLDSRPEDVGRDAERLLQAVLELIGLRHCKYKDALIKLSQSSAGPDAPLGPRPLLS